MSNHDAIWVTAAYDQLYAGIKDLASPENLNVLLAIAYRLYERGYPEAAADLRKVVMTLEGWAFEVAFGPLFDEGAA
jgi:hypothetical protein